MGIAEYIYFGGIVGGVTIYIVYSLIRMGYDSEYRKHVYEKARKEKAARRNKPRAHNPLAEDIFGNPMYPEEYARAKRKERNEWLNSF